MTLRSESCSRRVRVRAAAKWARSPHHMNIGHIAGGTNAGWRKVRQRAGGWTCPACGKSLKGFWKACPLDKTPRPEEA